MCVSVVCMYVYVWVCCVYACVCLLCMYVPVVCRYMHVCSLYVCVCCVYTCVLCVCMYACVYISCLLYPFICCWTFRPFPCLDCCTQCHTAYGGADLSVTWFPSDTDLAVGLLGHMAAYFRGASIPFSVAFPPAVREAPFSPHPC